MVFQSQHTYSNKFLTLSFIFLISTYLMFSNTANAEETTVEVWKSPNCSCCQGWVDYMEDNGFTVKAHNVPDVTVIKRHLGMNDPSIYSCHTAKIGDYLVEGHVPVKDIYRLLEEKPDILGLSAPGMPMMSPGMNSIEPKNYDVIQFDKDQEYSVFSSH